MTPRSAKRPAAKRVARTKTYSNFSLGPTVFFGPPGARARRCRARRRTSRPETSCHRQSSRSLSSSPESSTDALEARDAEADEVRTTRWSRTLLEDNGSAHGEARRAVDAGRAGVRDATRAGGRARANAGAGTARTPREVACIFHARGDLSQRHVAGSEKTIRPDLLILPGTPESERFRLRGCRPKSADDDGRRRARTHGRGPSSLAGLRAARRPRRAIFRKPLPTDGHAQARWDGPEEASQGAREALRRHPRGRRGAHRKSNSPSPSAPPRRDSSCISSTANPCCTTPPAKATTSSPFSHSGESPTSWASPSPCATPRSRATSRAARISCSRASAPSPRDPSAPANVSRSPSRETQPRSPSVRRR